MSFQRQSRHKRWLHRIRYWGLLCFTLVVLGWLGRPAQAQLTPLNADPTAPVVVNGRKVLDVKGVAGFTATERAQSINERLQEEVKLSQPTEIEVVVGENGPILRSEHSGNVLATVTDVDRRTPSYSLQRQAQEWEETLEPALRQGQWELQLAYFQQALLYGAVVLVGAIAIHLILHIFGRRSSRTLNRWFIAPGNPLTLWERPIKFFWQLGIIGL